MSCSTTQNDSPEPHHEANAAEYASAPAATSTQVGVTPHAFNDLTVCSQSAT